MSVVAFAFRIQPRRRGGWYVFAEHSRIAAQREFASRLRDLLRERGVPAESTIVSRGQGARYFENIAVVAPLATEADLPTIADAAAAVIRAEAAAA